MTRYGFRSALGAFFHANAEQAAALLPAPARPLESHPGLAVLALTVFDFDDTEVGAYRELVASVVVPPWAPRGEALPHAAFFPFLLATTTDASRAHAAARWQLPQLDRCLQIELESSPQRRTVTVHDDRQALLRLTVGSGAQVGSRRLYQCYSADAEHQYRVEIEIEGPLCEHEDELGELELNPHPLTATLEALLDDPIPFREQCMDAGEQRFATLVRHAPRRSPA